jgi:flavin-dependent dehydrogenase
MSEHFDVIVGGPAGSVAASSVAMRGNRVLLSGVGDEPRNAGFTVQRGANFRVDATV